MNHPETQVTPGTQNRGQINVRENQRGIKNEPSRETGNIGYTKHRTNKR